MKSINIDILTLVLLPFVFKLFDFISNFISEKFKLKSKKMELGDASIKACQEQHKDDIKEIRTEFNKRLDDVMTKMDKMTEKMTETQQKTQLQITRLRAGVEKNNNVIERTFKLETQVGNIEKDMGIVQNDIKHLYSK